MPVITANNARRIDVFDWTSRLLLTQMDNGPNDRNKTANSMNVTVASRDVLVRVQAPNGTFTWKRVIDGVAQPQAVWMAQLTPGHLPPGAFIRVLDAAGKVQKTVRDNAAGGGDFDGVARNIDIPVTVGSKGTVQAFAAGANPATARPLAKYSFGPAANSLKRLGVPAPKGPSASDALWGLVQIQSHWGTIVGSGDGLGAVELQNALKPGSAFVKAISTKRAAKLRGMVNYWTQPAVWKTFAGAATPGNLTKAELDGKVKALGPKSPTTSKISLTLPAGYTASIRTSPQPNVTAGWTKLVNGQALKIGQLYEIRVNTPDGKLWHVLPPIGGWGWGKLPASMKVLKYGNMDGGKGLFTLTRAGRLTYTTNGPGADPLRYGLKVTGFPPNATLKVGVPGELSYRELKTDAAGNVTSPGFMETFLVQMAGKSRFHIAVENGSQSFVVAFNRVGATNQWTQADLTISGGTASFKPIPGKQKGHELHLTRLPQVRIDGAPATAESAMNTAYTSYLKYRTSADAMDALLKRTPGSAMTSTAQHGAKTSEWISEVSGLAANLARDQFNAARDLTQLGAIDATGLQFKALVVKLTNKAHTLVTTADTAKLLKDLYTEPKALLTAATGALQKAADEAKKIKKSEANLAKAQGLSLALGIVGAAFGLAFGCAMMVQSIASNAVRNASVQSRNFATWRNVWRDGGVLFRSGGVPGLTRSQAWAQASWGLLDGLAMTSQVFDRVSYFNFLVASASTQVAPGVTSPARSILATLDKLPAEQKAAYVKQLTDKSFNPQTGEISAFTDAIRNYMLTNRTAARVAQERTPESFGQLVQAARPAALKAWHARRKEAILKEWDDLYRAHPWLRNLFEVQIGEPKQVEGTVHYTFDVITLPPK